LEEGDIDVNSVNNVSHVSVTYHFNLRP